MPGTVSDAPSVSQSFANNFWGKEDAGVSPLLGRMHDAKVTGDELKAFYTARAAIEEEYARKLLNLARKPLGSSETGTLRMSLDVVRAEVEAMGKQHQGIAGKMKTELEEPLAAFAGGIKERRKIVQAGIEKLLKVKMQQTSSVNKARDKYEQDCLKIKGYLAQGHMVMGQEERKNKAKLEKTQIQVSATGNEYEAAVKVLEETTGRWNRDWKAACDKFQDLEEERIDFMKSSLWTFANIASTVCVSDDGSCEKIRLSLEDCDVEKDILNFIKDQGTGQEIPDPPKFINFCRGDADDAASEASTDEAYTVAQFQRAMNPAFRSSSPQPSVLESHHDPNSTLAKALGHEEPPITMDHDQTPQPRRGDSSQSQAQRLQQQLTDVPTVPHNEYPQDGMTQFCRIPAPSERSSQPSPERPGSRDSQSEYSNPTSFSSINPSSGAASPTKHFNGSALSGMSASSDNSALEKKKPGFLRSHSPFRRKSKHEKDQPQAPPFNRPGSRSTWGPAQAGQNISPTRPARYGQGASYGNDKPSPSPEPVDPRANFQLNVGNNVFDVASPDKRHGVKNTPAHENLDPIAQALEELKIVTKQPLDRMSADRFHGLATPAPSGGSTPGAPGGVPTPFANSHITAAQRGTPPPQYDTQPMSRLGAPQPAFTSRQMQQTTQKYINQTSNMFNNAPPQQHQQQQHQQQHQPSGRGPPSAQSRPGTRDGSRGHDIIRATSPAPLRATSPRPGMNQQQHPHSPQQQQQQQQQPYRATSPNPYAAPSNNSGGRPRTQQSTHHPNSNNGTPSPTKPGYGSWGSSHSVGGGSPQYGHQPQQQMPRAASPNPLQPLQPSMQQQGGGLYSRPNSSRGETLALQLAPSPAAVHSQGGAPLQQGSGGGGGGYGGSVRGRPVSSYHSGGGGAPGSAGSMGAAGAAAVDAGAVARVRSKSVAEQRMVARDGRAILHYARAMYMYQAAIPEELSFAKGDILAVMRHQDDGWWEAEVTGKKGRAGLVPSNYLQNC
ncbi:hypothetical protein LTS18_010816 [Coniosporium uncinatum]|uniref:Uncharacterized protein n=1 Tax=Coniosporium uncinatum TaxID=93489 RepID=A0ACC3D9K3_9PEZI|nr:hypothetical protein LTS18_010816 [Coniosporium uncinatum]